MCVCPHVLSRTMAVVDTKLGYVIVGMCNRRSGQQESGAALSKNSMCTAGGYMYSVCISRES